MYSVRLSGEVMQAAASRASSGYSVNAPIPSVIPPGGSADSSPSTVCG